MSDEQLSPTQAPEAAPSRKGVGGPRTPEGRRSSLNACKTLITSKVHAAPKTSPPTTPTSPCAQISTVPDVTIVLPEPVIIPILNRRRKVG